MPKFIEPILVAALVFTGTFLGLRAIEWLYHRLRHTPDWSPHWGSWLFALLLAVYALVNNLGR
ncbi:MAG: hypothetical protein JWN01_579 [Patescibacteria group bacterium]|nr:hypothetical protein [Patescibacteria group bacterium]